MKCFCCGKKYIKPPKGNGCIGICAFPFCSVCEKCVMHCTCKEPIFGKEDLNDEFLDPYLRNETIT